MCRKLQNLLVQLQSIESKNWVGTLRAAEDFCRQSTGLAKRAQTSSSGVSRVRIGCKRQPFGFGASPLESLTQTCEQAMKLVADARLSMDTKEKTPVGFLTKK